MQSAKETAANIAASAKAVMEKTKATMQEKAEKMTTRDPLQKEMATEKKEERIHGAERQKQEARAHNVATKQAAAAAGGGTFGHDYATGGEYSTGTAHPTTGGYSADRAVRQDYPQGLAGQAEYPEGATGFGSGGVGPQDPNVGGGARTGYGSGNTI
ncbi:hypothetical protein DH2020_016738 [Rehmannia glutinosa]|uniref:Uncharacterized protein n=1 Tax=Rehmannia glutinosa TaxID=99300 RepID=A0ABR0WNU6_REHGL